MLGGLIEVARSMHSFSDCASLRTPVGRYDANQDGVLDLIEFTALVRAIDRSADDSLVRAPLAPIPR
jgi:hypothetical protein